MGQRERVEEKYFSGGEGRRGGGEGEERGRGGEGVGDQDSAGVRTKISIKGTKTNLISKNITACKNNKYLTHKEHAERNGIKKLVERTVLRDNIKTQLKSPQTTLSCILLILLLTSASLRYNIAFSVSKATILSSRVWNKKELFNNLQHVKRSENVKMI